MEQVLSTWSRLVRLGMHHRDRVSRLRTCGRIGRRRNVRSWPGGYLAAVDEATGHGHHIAERDQIDARARSRLYYRRFVESVCQSSRGIGVFCPTPRHPAGRDIPGCHIASTRAELLAEPLDQRCRRDTDSLPRSGATCSGAGMDRPRRSHSVVGDDVPQVPISLGSSCGCRRVWFPRRRDLGRFRLGKVGWVREQVRSVVVDRGRIEGGRIGGRTDCGPR